MEMIQQIEVAIVLFFQSIGEWIKVPMQAVSFLGQEEFFMVLLPFLYWCVDARVGLQFAAMTVLSNLGVTALKLAFRVPRPFWVASQVQPWSSETSFGMPSGHATTAASVWGVLAANLRIKWATLLIWLLVFLIGISRVFLGMHFLSQVVVGWLFGGLLLWLVLKFSPAVLRWLLRFPVSIQVLWIFLSSLMIIAVYLLFYLPALTWKAPALWVELGSRPLEGDLFNPVDLQGVFTLAGTWFGGMAGAALYYFRHGWLDTSGNFLQKIIRYLLGVSVVILLWYGLGSIFPRTQTLDAYVLRFIRYALMGSWMTFASPWFFKKLSLMRKTTKTL